jgi:Tfp pilus assembly PilM family ATPase
MDIRDGGAVGVWLAHELKQAGLGRPRLLFAAGRGEVVMKRMRLPKPTGKTEHEIAGMVRLQMARQVTVPLEGTAVDFLTLGEEPAEGGAPTVGVLAAAMPGDRLLWYDKVARGSGCKVARISLRPAGLAAMLADVSLTHSGPILGVGIGSASVEIVVVGSGHLLFARSADLGTASTGGDGEASLVQKIAIEAKRTWMSYRVSDESSVVDAVVVAGEGRLAKEIAERCGEALEMPWKLAPPARGVELPRGASEQERLAAVPVIGMLVEQASGRESLDFAHPRKAPDVAAARRQQVLAAAFGLIVVGGASWLFANRQIAGLDRDLELAKARGQSLQAEYNGYLKETARLDHIRAWTKPGADWVSHTRSLNNAMPAPTDAHLDQFAGRLQSVVTFAAKEGRYDSAGWKVSQEADFTLAGHAKRRDIADDLRRKLLSMYDQVENKGPDVPDRFAFDITENLSPSLPADSTKKPAPSKGGGE